MRRVSMRKLAGMVVGVTALFFGAQASAAPCTVGSCEVTDGVLAVGTPVGVSGADVELGAVDHQGSFAIGGGLAGLEGFIDVTFSTIFPGETTVRTGIANMTIELFQDAISLGAFAITDADGLSILPVIAVNFLSGSDVFFQIAGVSFRNAGASLPDYNIDFQAVEAAAVPIPGAFLLLLSGVAGLGFSMRRKPS